MVSVDTSFISSEDCCIDSFDVDSGVAETTIERRTASRKLIDLIIVIVEFCARVGLKR
jgi:hypothetical protein